MPETQTRPTTQDENWRYADMAAVDGLMPAAFDTWQEISIPAGESRRHCMEVGAETPELHRIRIAVGEKGRAELFAVNSGADYTRVEVQVRLERGAHFEFGGVTIGGGDAVREFVTRIDHVEPDATSNQVIRAVHWGQARGNFLGQINVARHAQKTDAGQDFKGLVLEKGASVNAVPQLEIYADDVKCAHGASVGQLDETARFYMAARGLSPDLAQRLLVQAFIGDAFVALSDEAENHRLTQAALARLEDM